MSKRPLRPRANMAYEQLTNVTNAVIRLEREHNALKRNHAALRDAHVANGKRLDEAFETLDQILLPRDRPC